MMAGKNMTPLLLAQAYSNLRTMVGEDPEFCPLIWSIQFRLVFISECRIEKMYFLVLPLVNVVTSLDNSLATNTFFSGIRLGFFA